MEMPNIYTHEDMVRLCDEARAIEREECARACEEMEKDIVCPEECAAIIRARKE